ncbi:olfactory receptor 14C36-like [Eublepharis macularius]|uniref:Olfactory receptor n=1 Tax=Eublepharis macularius TaxID=481883 RepID=A0AA97LBE2_EUBMA|nr:olfactory receptor 14C36-like [Eublepharis macularius]
MSNQTTVTQFFLLAFSDLLELQILHFVVFLSIYVATLLGNFLLILAVAQNPKLHSPMYFFLVNLSLSDICYISVTIPKSMAISLTSNTLISFSGCAIQVLSVAFCATAELTFLSVMAYDRYVAICHPLQYTMIMNWNACFQMAAAAWSASIINSGVQTANTFRLCFCGSTVAQFFCDVPLLLMLSCTDTTANIWCMVGFALTLGSFCFTLILFSYVFIFSTVLKIQSAQARYKTFSTCTPHLTIFSLFISTIVFSYFRPKSLSSPLVNQLADVLYAVLPPLMNPIIYSLRNKDIQVAMQKLSKKVFGSYWMFR